MLLLSAAASKQGAGADDGGCKWWRGVLEATPAVANQRWCPQSGQCHSLELGGGTAVVVACSDGPGNDAAVDVCWTAVPAARDSENRVTLCAWVQC